MNKMDRSTIEKFRRHMGVGKTIKLKTMDGQEDEFYFKPLTCEYLPDFMKLAYSFDKTPVQKKSLREMQNQVAKGLKTTEDMASLEKEIEDENSSKMLQEDNAEILIKLMVNMVKFSYPDLDDETLKSFVLSNFTTLQALLFELHENMGQNTVDERILKKIEQAREAQKVKQAAA